MKMNHSVEKRITSGILVLVLSLSVILPVIAAADISWISLWSGTISGFEKTDPVYTTSVIVGTEQDELSLPESIRAFVPIPSDMDVTTFTQVVPSVDSSTGTDYYTYYDYGYIQPSDAATNYASGELVIYTILYASEDGSGDVGEIGYRIYGSLEGSTEVWFECDADGNILSGIIDLPVTWSGDYDGDTLGEYTFTAEITEEIATELNYTYKGDMPTAVVTVYEEDSSCDCDEVTVSESSHSVISDETSSISVMSVEITEEDYGISTMALDDTTDYTYGTDEDGNALQMSDLISSYVTSRISSSGNDSTTEGVSGDWIDYLNSTWLNVVGTLTTNSDGSLSWTSQCTWKEQSEISTIGVWGGSDGSSADYIASGKSQAIDNFDTDTNTWKVYNGEHLLYAMTNYTSGDTILLCSDIDLNGIEYNWEAVELAESVTIDGDGYTIYNLGNYVEAEYTENDDGTYTLGKESGFAYFYGYYEDFVIKDLYFDTGKLICDATVNAPEGENPEDYIIDFSLFGQRGGTSSLTFENVHVNNYLVCSKASSVSVLLGMQGDISDDPTINTDSYECTNTIDNCSVSNSWVYGHDHTGSLATFATDIAFTNSYAVGNTLVSTGYHSGSFVSCLNNRSTFDSCFAADNYLYAASQSGGFVGYAGDAADYTNCYASGIVEGYEYIGGFAGVTAVGHDYLTSSYITTSRNYNTFTNCYSTTLVGMRTETKNSGGFIGRVAYHGERAPTDATVFDSCYAAGEVGSTQTVDSYNSNYVGGFVGYDQTYDNSYDTDGNYTTEYINCYYDKQTTAMREWVSGRYNSSDDTHIYDIDIMGVLTSDTEKFGTGLTSEPNSSVTAHTEDADNDGIEDDPEYGFIGFTNNSDWVYTTEEHYPELTVFANATSTDWNNPELVQAYSLASTATVILDTWDYGYNWDETTGIRSDEKELYYGTYNTTDDHIGDRFTYDTVREVVSNASITESATFEEMIDGGILTQSYYYDSDNLIEYDDDKNITTDKDALTETKYNGISAFTLNNTANTLTVDAPGIDWYDITELDETGAEVGSRPIRLVSFMKVDAGEDQSLSASDYYDHRDDAYFTMVDTIKQNMVVSLDADVAWSTSVMQIYPEDNEAFYAVDTVDTQFTASEGAWVNTEIWRAELATWDLTDEDFVYDDEKNMYYYTETDSAGAETVHWFYIGQDGVIYYEDADGTLSELYEGEASVDADGNVSISYYTAEYSVKVYGTEEGDTLDVTQDKWNGEIPLYPDIAETQYYIVRYYWVLDNGRYRSDYKIIEITDESVDVDQYHDVTINVYNDHDNSANDTVMAVYADGYGVTEDTEDSANPVDNTPTFATDTSSSYTTWTDPDVEGSEEKSVTYQEDSYVSWVQKQESAIITKTELIMTSNNGYVVGYVEQEGSIGEGDTITIPIETFYLVYTYDEAGEITGQTTQSSIADVTYIVKEDSETGGLYLEFAQTTTVYDDDEAVTTIDDTSYNIEFNIYVEESASITVTKEITNYTDPMSVQSFIIDFIGLDVQVALTHEETSLPIYTNDFDENGEFTFYIDEVLPMEFELDSITYIINEGESQNYDSDTGITIGIGDEVAILVQNTYEGEAYFKDRDEVTNIFEGISDDAVDSAGEE